MKLGRILLVLVVLGGAGYGAYAYYEHRAAAPAEARNDGRGGRRQRGGTADNPIPVLAAAATTADVPIYLDALGTVQAFNTVNVKVMVDGPLVEVRFREGQDVKNGDVLVRIDSRTYQGSSARPVRHRSRFLRTRP